MASTESRHFSEQFIHEAYPGVSIDGSLVEGWVDPVIEPTTGFSLREFPDGNHFRFEAVGPGRSEVMPYPEIDPRYAPDAASLKIESEQYYDVVIGMLRDPMRRLILAGLLAAHLSPETIAELTQQSPEKVRQLVGQMAFEGLLPQRQRSSLEITELLGATLVPLPSDAEGRKTNPELKKLGLLEVVVLEGLQRSMTTHDIASELGVERPIIQAVAARLWGTPYTENLKLAFGGALLTPDQLARREAATIPDPRFVEALVAWKGLHTEWLPLNLAEVARHLGVSREMTRVWYAAFAPRLIAEGRDIPLLSEDPFWQQQVDAAVADRLSRNPPMTITEIQEDMGLSYSRVRAAKERIVALRREAAQPQNTEAGTRGRLTSGDAIASKPISPVVTAILQIHYAEPQLGAAEIAVRLAPAFLVSWSQVSDILYAGENMAARKKLDKSEPI